MKAVLDDVVSLKLEQHPERLASHEQAEPATWGCHCLGLGVGVPNAITGVGGQLNRPTP